MMSDNKRETRTKRMKVHLSPQKHEWIKERLAQAGIRRFRIIPRRFIADGCEYRQDHQAPALRVQAGCALGAHRAESL